MFHKKPFINAVLNRVRLIAVLILISFAFLGILDEQPPDTTNAETNLYNAQIDNLGNYIYDNDLDYDQIQNNYMGESSGSGGVSDPPAPIEPEKFETENGFKAWKVHLPHNAPLATPAYGDDKIFIGGGFGTYSFYALDAKSGELEWHYGCGDDGPTAAVVYENRVAFNTESCILYVLDTKTGKEIWQEWLGDPLMSQPAIADDRVYIAYPKYTEGNSHVLTCRDLETGELYWDQPISSEAITAPIVNRKSVFVSTVGGMVYHISAKTGAIEWQEQKNATSAPWIDEFGEIYVALREEMDVGGGETEQHEGLGILSPTEGRLKNEGLYTKRKADYLNYDTTSDYYKDQVSMDSSVGFGVAPAAANLDEAQANIGLGSVSGVWAYQGSRPLVYDGVSYSAQGDIMNAIDNKTGDILWETKYSEGDNVGGRPLTPPAMAGQYLLFGSLSGEILCVRAEDGKEEWSVNIGEPIRFQPCVAKGRIYVGTDFGNIYCIDTGDKKFDGWYMWGGNAQHNGYSN